MAFSSLLCASSPYLSLGVVGMRNRSNRWYRKENKGQHPKVEELRRSIMKQCHFLRWISLDAEQRPWSHALDLLSNKEVFDRKRDQFLNNPFSWSRTENDPKCSCFWLKGSNKVLWRFGKTVERGLYIEY